jgi:hypothetical protein
MCLSEASNPLSQTGDQATGYSEKSRPGCAESRLEGYTNREIGDVLECSERGIERKLNLIRKRWEAGLEAPDE